VHGGYPNALFRLIVWEAAPNLLGGNALLSECVGVPFYELIFSDYDTDTF
jgi:hypothetical protein